MTVTKVVSSLSKGSTSPNKTTYTAGEHFDPTGLTITATYSDSTSSDVTSSVVWTPDPLTAGTTSVTGSFGGKTITITGLTVNAATEPEMIDSNSDLSVGDYVVLRTAAGVGVTGWNNNKDATVSETESEWKKFYVASASNSGFTLKDESANNFIANPGSSNQFVYGSAATCSTDSSGHLICNSRYLCKNGTNYRFYTSIGSYLPFFIYKVPASSSSKTLSSISLDTSNVTTEFYVSDTFNYTGLVVTANYTDSTSATVSPTSVSSPDMSSVGNKTVTVSYTEGAVTKTASYSISVLERVITGIIATVSKTYYVGDTISASDITVKNNSDEIVSPFTFANDGYRFTYADASSGGALTNKVFTNAITGAEKTCSLTVQVQRAEHSATSTEDCSVSYTDLPTTYQTSTTERTAASGIKFIAYNLANYSSKMQFKASGGYFQTTQALDLQTLTINNRETNALTVYASNNANSFSQTITGANDVYDVSGYSYVKVMKNGSGAAYCASITLTIGHSDTAINFANYVMYEDTTNQCKTKLSTAITYFGDLSKAERVSFMEDDTYVLNTARERFVAWLSHEGKTVTKVNDDYVINASQNALNPIINVTNNYSLIVTLITLFVGASLVGGYFFLKRKKQDNQ